MSYQANTRDLTREGCVLYLKNWIGLLKEQIDAGEGNVALHKEHVDFLTKAVEELEKK